MCFVESSLDDSLLRWVIMVENVDVNCRFYFILFYMIFFYMIYGICFVVYDILYMILIHFNVYVLFIVYDVFILKNFEFVENVSTSC